MLTYGSNISMGNWLDVLRSSSRGVQLGYVSCQLNGDAARMKIFDSKRCVTVGDLYCKEYRQVCISKLH